MAEYIEREAVLEIVNQLDDRTALVVGRKVVNLPAADVAPVVHAKWIYHDDDNTCSACGKTVTEHNDLGKKQWFPLCPYCGAKMDLKD